MSYFGKQYESGPTFDPADIVQINNVTSLTNLSVGKKFLLNSPANYTVTLPQLSSLQIGDSFTFVHNAATGNVTLSTFVGDFIELLGIGNASLSVSPGNVISIQKVDTGTNWIVTEVTDRRTASQGTNDVTTASTAFVINEFGKHKNYLINGNFDFWQRSVSGTVDAGTTKFFADRWAGSATGSSFTIGQQPFTVGQTAVPNEPTFFSRQNVTSVAGAGNFCQYIQKIESVRNLAGKTATLSFWAKADANKNIAIEFAQQFGTGGTTSAPVTSIGVTTISLSTSWQKYTITVAIPSISGKTLGTNLNDSLNLTIWLDAGSSFNSRTNSLGQQSGTFDFAQFQLEEGNVATQFEIRHKQIEADLCYRYYYKNTDSYVAIAALTTDINGDGGPYITMFYPVEMRALPVVTCSETSLGASNYTFRWTSKRGFEKCIYASGGGGYFGSATYIISSFTADAEL